MSLKELCFPNPFSTSNYFPTICALVKSQTILLSFCQPKFLKLTYFSSKLPPFTKNYPKTWSTHFKSWIDIPKRFLWCSWPLESLAKISFSMFGYMEMHKWLWKCITETNVMENIKCGEIYKPIILSIPKPSRTP